jgi:hypothetical protein
VVAAETWFDQYLAAGGDAGVLRARRGFRAGAGEGGDGGGGE